MDISAEYDSMNPDQPLSPPKKTFEATPITEFYSGKSVFITGGTGFLGTVLIGKLLTTCPVKRVYMLIKAKDGTSVQQRLAEFIKSSVFDEIRVNNISALDNLVPISGNICEKQLGMNDGDIAMLCSEVQVIVHSAASINMDLEVNEAITVNTKATAELVRLCQGMLQLRVFLYVSTAYSNCQRPLIDERVYEPSASIEAICSIFEDVKKGQILDGRRKYLMENRPNTYTFSKSLAEKIVQEGFNGVPSVIVRPSISIVEKGTCKFGEGLMIPMRRFLEIPRFLLGSRSLIAYGNFGIFKHWFTVLSSLKYPEPGWTSSWSAPNRLLLAIAGGYLRCFAGDADCPLDIVPADQVANLIIASVWAADKHQNEEVKVFNCCTSFRNPISVGRYLQSGIDCARKYSWTASFSRFFIIVKYRILFKILWFFLQTIPAYVLDTLSFLMLRKPKMTKANASLIRALEVTNYFASNEFNFIDRNIRELLKDMDPWDQALFDFDFNAIDWNKYLENNVLGLQKYLMKK